jgi:hypothetical protein
VPFLAISVHWQHPHWLFDGAYTPDISFGLIPSDYHQGVLQTAPYEESLLIGVMMMETTKGLPWSRSA